MTADGASWGWPCSSGLRLVKKNHSDRASDVQKNAVSFAASFLRWPTDQCRDRSKSSNCLALFPSPALGERRHRSFACRLTAVSFDDAHPKNRGCTGDRGHTCRSNQLGILLARQIRGNGEPVAAQGAGRSYCHEAWPHLNSAATATENTAARKDGTE